MEGLSHTNSYTFSAAAEVRLGPESLSPAASLACLPDIIYALLLNSSKGVRSTDKERKNPKSVGSPNESFYSGNVHLMSLRIGNLWIRGLDRSLN